jgi:DNA polymerase III epsilon subunit-like protein
MLALIMDTETSSLVDSGLIPLDRQPEVIEFCGFRVDLDTGEHSTTLDTLIRPQRPISDEITKITGITNDLLATAESWSEEAANDIIAYLEDSAPVVIAHNASFDVEVLNFMAARVGRAIRWPRVICTVEQTCFYAGYRLSLQALHENLFGVPFKEAHRARTDVAALTACCIELRKRGDL